MLEEPSGSKSGAAESEAAQPRASHASSAPDPAHNFVQWLAKYGPNSRTHSRLLAPRENGSALRRCDGVLFALYRGSEAPGMTFGQFVELVRRRYNLAAYLLSLRDEERLMRIAMSVLDEAFERAISGKATHTMRRHETGRLAKMPDIAAGIRQKTASRRDYLLFNKCA